VPQVNERVDLSNQRAEDAPITTRAAQPPSSVKPPEIGWWRATTDTWLCGVFEGGGAKGAAYGPTLRALRDERCWFSSVAGASAGAITAAIVAAGYRPEAIEAGTLDALEMLDKGSVKKQFLLGWSRLRQNSPHVAPSDGLSALIEYLLAQALVGEVGASRVTFKQLFNSTNIELFVVAVDAISQREFVFHHDITPDESVTSAALASAAIPFYFPAGLRAATGDGNHDAILFDGGMWSNFPTWIYRDRSFSQFHFGEVRFAAETGAREAPLFVGVLLDETRTPTGTTAKSYTEQKRNPWDTRLWKRVLAWATFMLTSPILAASFWVFAFAAAIVLARVWSPGAGGEVAGAWDAHRFEVLVVLGAFWLLSCGFQLYRLLRRERAMSDLLIPGDYHKLEHVGSLLGVFPLIFATYLIHSASGIEASADTGSVSWFEILLTVGAAVFATALVGWGLVALVFAGPAAMGLAPWVVPALMSAGSARYWAGTATGDRVVRVGVNGLKTLDFGKARSFLEREATSIYGDVKEQWRQLRPPPAA
jgi:predicted acylesterase/phospholipase RssA